MTSFQRAAELQALLEGVALPASRDQLIEYAVSQSGGAIFRSDLEQLSEREFGSLDEVGEELAGVQPHRPRVRSKTPKPESGLPPGGEAYTDASAERGAVREYGPRR